MSDVPAGQRLTCRTCHDRFWRVKGSKRVHCEECSPPRVRSEPATVTPVAPRNEAAAVGPLERRAADELEEVGRLETLTGEALLYVARQLDTGGHTGSQTAALMQRLLEVRNAALAGVKRQADRGDELRRRREAKAAGA